MYLTTMINETMMKYQHRFKTIVAIDDFLLSISFKIDMDYMHVVVFIVFRCIFSYFSILQAICWHFWK